MNQNLRKPLYVIIDNGHGTRQYTKGKCSPDKRLYEGEWNREFAKMLASFLDEHNIKHYMLVTEDKDIKLRERVARTNSIYSKMISKYEVILISIHINAASSDSQWHDARGFTVWASTNAGKKSKKLAKLIGQKATDLNLRGNRWIPKDQYHTAGFTIIHDTKCPAILCEHMFMDNKIDLEMLLSEDGKDQLLEIYRQVLPNLDLSTD